MFLIFGTKLLGVGVLFGWSFCLQKRSVDNFTNDLNQIIPVYIKLLFFPECVINIIILVVDNLDHFC